MACPVGPAVVHYVPVGGHGGGSRANRSGPGGSNLNPDVGCSRVSGPEGSLGSLAGG